VLASGVQLYIMTEWKHSWNNVCLFVQMLQNSAHMLSECHHIASYLHRLKLVHPGVSSPTPWKVQIVNLG
jgi:hypothetical protein